MLPMPETPKPFRIPFIPPLDAEQAERVADAMIFAADTLYDERTEIDNPLLAPKNKKSKVKPHDQPATKSSYSNGAFELQFNTKHGPDCAFISYNGTGFDAIEGKVEPRLIQQLLIQLRGKDEALFERVVDGLAANGTPLSPDQKRHIEAVNIHHKISEKIPEFLDTLGKKMQGQPTTQSYSRKDIDQFYTVIETQGVMEGLKDPTDARFSKNERSSLGTLMRNERVIDVMMTDPTFAQNMRMAIQTLAPIGDQSQTTASQKAMEAVKQQFKKVTGSELSL
jgi:hypothetical protein